MPASRCEGEIAKGRPVQSQAGIKEVRRYNIRAALTDYVLLNRRETTIKSDTTSETGKAYLRLFVVVSNNLCIRKPGNFPANINTSLEEMTPF